MSAVLMYAGSAPFASNLTSSTNSQEWYRAGEKKRETWPHNVSWSRCIQLLMMLSGHQYHVLERRSKQANDLNLKHSL